MPLCSHLQKSVFFTTQLIFQMVPITFCGALIWQYESLGKLHRNLRRHFELQTQKKTLGFREQVRDTCLVGMSLTPVLKLGFEKSRVLIQKRVFLACRDMLRGHF